MQAASHTRLGHVPVIRECKIPLAEALQRRTRRYGDSLLLPPICCGMAFAGKQQPS